MNPFIDPPRKMPLIFRVVAWITDKKLGVELLPIKILAWYPKTAIGSGILESLVAHGKKDLTRRMLPWNMRALFQRRRCLFRQNF